MRTIGFVFARGGSKGAPGKNIRRLAGKPLIAHSIATARACPSIETVIVSTDDRAIADVALEHGAEVPFLRPPELATDSAPEWLSWQHAIGWFEEHRGRFDVFVSLPATSPLRAVEDVETCLARLHADPPTDLVITVRKADRSPYYNMVRLDSSGYASVVVAPGKALVRRQDAPPVFDITTVAYVSRPSFIRHAKGLFDGRVSTVLVPPERAIDIDTDLDFRVAECLASRPC